MPDTGAEHRQERLTDSLLAIAMALTVALVLREALEVLVCPCREKSRCGAPGAAAVGAGSGGAVHRASCTST